jgi:dipeptidyl aminopeptidase/acylaminoacyl peptidase
MVKQSLAHARRHALIVAATLFLPTLPAAHAQQPAAVQPATAAAAARLKEIPIADYARWRSIQGATIAATGDWVAWSYGQVRRDDVLHVRHVDTGREHTVERASRPVFSDDGRWVAYSVAPPLADVDKLEKDKKPVPRRAELMNLATGEKVGWDDVASFEFAKGSSHLVVKKQRPEPKPKHEGADLILRNLRPGADELIGSVAWHAFNKPGTLLAYATDAADMDGNGLYLVELGSGVRRTLDNAREKYARATWSENGGALAVLRGKDADTLAQRPNTLLVFTAVGTRAQARTEIDGTAAGLPPQHVLSERSALIWNEAADRLFFGIKDQEVKPKKQSLEEWQKPSDVNVFHWNDERIQSVQEKQAETERNRTQRAVLHVANRRVVTLTDATLRNSIVGRDGRWVVGWDDRAYVSDWQEPRGDYYRVDVNTGARAPMLQAHTRTLGLSPDGSRFLYWKDDHVWAYELATDRHVNLTAKAPVSFVNAEWDYLSSKPPYGVTGFTKDGRGVILDHRYDLWFVPFDGSAPRNLTNGIGGEHAIRLRYVRLDPEEQFIDLAKPLLLTAYGQWTKQAGFYQLRDGRMRELLFTDNSYGGVQKAAQADRVLFTRQSWTEYPDLQVARLDFAQPAKVSDANPHQTEYAWGRRILFDYTNRDGVRLQGTLAIPNEWQPGQRLPMIVQFYEKNSQNLHTHPVPRYAGSPQFAPYVSQGYLVMQPDVHFRGGSSHSDMLECVEAAVARVVELGYADPARVGLHGHSFSGGGASYIATRSKAFAAIVAGAAPINLVGEFNIIFRGTGQNNHSYDIHGQGRYGSNPYENFDRYWNQSPISGVTTMNTPLLYMHGDNDQIVEYNQGLEFYNALRFNRKPVIFVSYPGEGHGLTKLENQLDFLTRMEQFYAHYLKGAPKPIWVERGEPFIDKTKRQPIPINVEKPKPATTTTTTTPPGGGR